MAESHADNHQRGQLPILTQERPKKNKKNEKNSNQGILLYSVLTHDCDTTVYFASYCNLQTELGTNKIVFDYSEVFL